MKPYLFAFALLMPSLAQGEVPADPWTLVPPFPTGCYGEQDDFNEVVDKRIETLTAEIEQQDNRNEEIKGPTLSTDSSGAVDPWAMQRQMMENMQKNPQAAMQTSQAADESLQPTREAEAAQEAKDRAQKEKLAKLIARYEAEFKAATKTNLVFLTDGWSEGRTQPLGDGVSPGGGSTMYTLIRGTPTTQEQLLAYSRKIDQVYVTQVCPQWWKTGSFHTWFADYRAFLVADLPRQERVEATQNAPLKMQGVNLDAYHSTAKMKAVKKYLLAIHETFGKRWEHSGQPPAQ